MAISQPELTRQRAPQRTVGVVGEPGVGKTTIASVLGSRLADRTGVTVTGEAQKVTLDPDAIATGSDVPPANLGGRSSLGIDWHIIDIAPGVDAFHACASSLDTAIIVTTPDQDSLDAIKSYRRVATTSNIDCHLVATQLEDGDRDRIKNVDGPDLAQYFYFDSRVPEATTSGTVPQLAERTIDPILIELLQPERLEPRPAICALESGRRSIVNVEVSTKETAISVSNRFHENGYPAAYFRCNCRNHLGHILARASDHEE